MFKKVLIANRGEIAVRIARSCKKMGIRSVAVFSEIDSRALHVREADEARLIGPSPSKASYLDGVKIIDAALAHGCEAIHPGYGFLSENPGFAEAVSRAGLTFIGPPAAVIATMGDKIASKRMAGKAGLTVVPGRPDPVSDPDDAVRAVREIGYPVLLKPAAGGGGRGMRIVYGDDEVIPALRDSQEETRKAFGDDRIFLERYIDRPRHVEVQILADHFGKVVHFGERECSIQRRYQKIIEESPSPAVDDALRRKMGDMACALAREAGYTNAGTVEFILDPEGNVYFLEMNTRLQVEHPVTEMVTGVDLVELQLRVAAGEPLPLRQEDIRLEGWAMEARVCAEDPARNFLPSTGLITRYAAPRGKNIRVDSGVEAGSLVSVYYDSMLAKVTARGDSRERAGNLLSQALNRYHIEGPVTNLHFVNSILNHPAFIRGELSTAFIGEHFENGRMKIPPPPERLHFPVMAATLIYHNRQYLVRDSLRPMAARVGRTHEQEAWHRYRVKGEENVFDVLLRGDETLSTWTIRVDNNEYRVVPPRFEFYRRRLKLRINGESHYFQLQYQENFIWAAYCGISRTFEIYNPLEWRLAEYMRPVEKTEEKNVLRSPMPGLLVEVRVQEGDRVYRGQDIVVIESMKMETGVSSPCDGEVAEIIVTPGQTVETGDTLLVFKPC